jgi:hypothetical protein
MRDESKARNEELFRNVNEQIEALSQTVERDDPLMEYLCECDRQDCYVKSARRAPSTSRFAQTRPISSSRSATKIRAWSGCMHRTIAS